MGGMNSLLNRGKTAEEKYCPLREESSGPPENFFRAEREFVSAALTGPAPEG